MTHSRLLTCSTGGQLKIAHRFSDYQQVDSAEGACLVVGIEKKVKRILRVHRLPIMPD